MIKRFFNDIYKYRHYIKYSVKADIKAEITDSYLGWIWLILEPLCFLLIYTFIALVVFKSSVEYFAIFVFIGLSIWNFFQKTLTKSVKLVSSNQGIVTKVYIPKHILLINRMGVNGFKMLVSFLLVFIFMIIFQVPLSLNVLFFLPLIFLTVLVTFSISVIFLHLGVFIEDLVNIINIALRLMFYMTGIFFAISTRVPYPYNEILLKLNPIAFLAHDLRNVLIYQQMPNGFMILIWFVIGMIFSYIGIKTIYENENTYVKVMK